MPASRARSKPAASRARRHGTAPARVVAQPIEPVVPRLFVSSSHLVSPRSRELSEFEFGLILVSNAFHRWVVRCMSAAGLKDLTPLEVLLLHHVNHRAREKKLADICFMLNIEDTHVVAYALKKLVGLGLMQTERRGKEVLFSTSAAGQEHIERYRQVREACLVAALAKDGSENARLGELAAFLRFLSGMYDQAARAATSL
ncbi:MAG: winged helix DNA-binding protein [Burkholderiales bacterium]|nr:winged helix DNA-binding protein [Burkholderiales bacterium]MCA3229370.1 winged helix DNA-binding protein [Burkholderiales bacterium]